MIAERDRTIRDQASALERVTSELTWLGLDDNALKIGPAYLFYRRAMAAHKHWSLYRSRLLPFVARHRHTACLQVTGATWAEHSAKRARDKVGRWKDRTISSCTLDNELTITHMFFRWLVRNGKLPRDPLDGTKGSGEPHGRESYLELEDVLKLLDGAGILEMGDDGKKYPRRPLLFRAFFEVKFRTGLRFATVRQLRRDRIGPDGIVQLGAKTQKGRRPATVAIPKLALDAIRAVPQLGSDPRIFTRLYKGAPKLVSGEMIRQWFRRVAKATGVASLAVDGETLVPHTLRHSAASYLDAQGASALDVRDFLHHASVKTTEPYLHRKSAQKALAMADMMGGRAVGKS